MPSGLSCRHGTEEPKASHSAYSMFPLRRTRYTQGFETTAHRMNFQIPPALPALELDVFARAASQGETLYVTKAGEQFQVIASGTTPSGRNVSWVATDEDTLVMFSSALALAYGTGIARAVAKELDLHAVPTTSLSARVVTRAVDMAETHATPCRAWISLPSCPGRPAPTPPASDRSVTTPVSLPIRYPERCAPRSTKACSSASHPPHNQVRRRYPPIRRKNGCARSLRTTWCSPHTSRRKFYGRRSARCI